jgi:photosystem II stability/assembly factor-like uncharacterized protein
MRFFKSIPLGLVAFVSFICSSASAQSPGSVPYEWRNVTIRGGGFVTGLLFHPREKNLLYARTDVGGAYRSEDAGGHWIPITDWITGIDFTGIESFAVDPADANRIYLAGGIYSGGRAAILRSADRGLTWEKTEVPFKMGGNEAGRSNGERLAVDPRDGKILFFGSRHDGLFRSGDAGVTWERVNGFPNIESGETADPPPGNPAGSRGFRGQPVGIVSIFFNPRGSEDGKSTGTIYAGVSTAGTNIFRSADGGKTWEAVPHQPLGLRPNHAVLSSDGSIYLSYGREPGPNTMTAGAVWKYTPASDVWTEISPLKSAEDNQPFGYGAVAVDTQHPSNLVVTTFAHWRPHDEVFYSTNGGQNWTALLQDAQLNYSNAPYTSRLTPHWMGSIAIDPFDSNRGLFTTGYGIWRCDNLTDAAMKPTRWEFADIGLEETVAQAVISPPEGAHLLSGLADIDGFRHDDLDRSPAGTFDGPRFTTTEDIAFAGANPSTIVRTGSGGTNVHAAISTDGGKNWSRLPSEPPGYGRGGGNIAISADGKTIVWSERNSAPNVTSDGGAHWSACGGMALGARVTADAINPARFYGLDSRSGKFFASTNAAADFFELGGITNASAFRWSVLSATPGIEGDLWLNCQERGLYHQTGGAEGFLKVPAVKEARAIGFGKAAEGKTFPAIYLIGRIGEVNGLFRSTDSGTTWVRINDDQHQYGGINCLTGDPRIFGRVYLATSGRGIIYGNPVADLR